MDLHLMYPLLQFLEEREIYSPETLMQAKLELLKPTNMVDFASSQGIRFRSG
jgi:translation initiation factor 3 subunit E